MKTHVALMSCITSVAAFALNVFPATAQQTGRAATGITPEVKQALVETLAGTDGEFAAHALYSAILKKYGDVQPYLSIREAEARHIQALKRQMEKYGIAIPEDKFAGKVTPPETLLLAAIAGVEAEKQNIALHDRYLTLVKGYPDITRVFTNLQRASREAHLPAFEAAAGSNGQLDPEQMQSLHSPRGGRGKGRQSK